MLQFLNNLVTLKRDEKGVTALEYGLIAALIAVAIIAGVSTLGNSLALTFNNVAGKFGSGVAAGTSNSAGVVSK